MRATTIAAVKKAALVMVITGLLAGCATPPGGTASDTGAREAEARPAAGRDTESAAVAQAPADADAGADAAPREIVSLAQIQARERRCAAAAHPLGRDIYGRYGERARTTFGDAYPTEGGVTTAWRIEALREATLEVVGAGIAPADEAAAAAVAIVPCLRSAS